MNTAHLSECLKSLAHADTIELASMSVWGCPLSFSKVATFTLLPLTLLAANVRSPPTRDRLPFAIRLAAAS